jgi:hypothetical protein
MIHNSGSSFSLVYFLNKLCCVLLNVPLAPISTRYGKERIDVQCTLLEILQRHGHSCPVLTMLA